MDIGFGQLALPLAAVDRIEDPERAAEAAPARHWLGASGGVSFPLSPDFGLSWGASAGWEFRTPFLPGLKAGLAVGYDNLAFTAHTQVRFANKALSAYLLYTFDGILPGVDFFAPYLGLGGGAVLVTVFDRRPAAPVDQRGILTSAASLQAGVEWRLPARISLRTGGGLDVVLQTGGVFLLPKAGLGLYFGF